MKLGTAENTVSPPPPPRLLLCCGRELFHAIVQSEPQLLFRRPLSFLTWICCWGEEERMEQKRDCTSEKDVKFSPLSSDREKHKVCFLLMFSDD
ncbi:hypothetical protein GJAV_G00184730 [Gymnothorax javanicus]|nr:hypothetical protein GJAV_G00184730 [Gymnothorax javanicus]